MKKNFDIKLIAVLLFLLNSFVFHSQIDSDQKMYYKWFDSIVGDGNISLYNGIQYKEKYRTLKGNHKYYLSTTYQIGNLVYENQSYYDVSMKYDLFNDQLIVKLPFRSGFNFIQLDKEKVDEFTINNNHFHSIFKQDEKPLSKDNYGYFQALFNKNNIILYKKLIKNRKEYFDKEFIYSVFTEEDKYFIYLKNQIHEISSKGSLIKLFPKQKKDINTFYNTNRQLKKSNLDSWMIQLIERLGKFPSNNTTIK
jgi:hypothetical protein